MPTSTLKNKNLVINSFENFRIDVTKSTLKLKKKKVVNTHIPLCISWNDKKEKSCYKVALS